MAIVLSLLIAVLWVTESAASQYAALEDKDLYAGIATMLFIGDDAAGSGTEEFLFGVSLSGLTDYLVWQAFWGKSFDEDAMLAGGSVDYILTHNFDDFNPELGCAEDYKVWWVAAGPTMVSHRDSFADAQGVGLDGEELGVNIGLGVNGSDTAVSFYLHFFPDSQNTMLSAALAHSF